MSDTTPAPAVDYLDEPGPDRTGRRWMVVGAAAAGLLGVAGAGAWGMSQLMGGGQAPATAVPADALAYVALDLDPSAGQKIAALQTLRKLPAFREHLGVTGGDDLRRSLFEALTASASCKTLDFDKDVAPWLGSRLAVAVLPGGRKPTPVGVVQVEDHDAATVGIRKLAACADEPVPGTAFSGDYLVLAPTAADARKAAADADQDSLAADGDFQRWVDQAGGGGVVTGYFAAAAAGTLADEPTAGDLAWSPTGAAADRLRASLKGFQGAAVVMRFSGGAFEVETAAGVDGLPSAGSVSGDGGLSDLPASTAVALGAAVGDHAARDLLSAVDDAAPGVDGMLQQWAAAAGLSLPEDLQTLLGDGVSVAVDSTFDFGAVVDGGATKPSDLPVGVRIAGDPDRIRPVLDKVVSALGIPAGDLVVRSGDHAVAVGADPGYVAILAGDGGLGGQSGFTAALPELADGSAHESAHGGLYVDLDAGDLATVLDRNAPDQAKVNLEPLRALGLTGRVEGEVAHLVLRLTTD